jgi:hydroxybutyrate-dimer hydrolase
MRNRPENRRSLRRAFRKKIQGDFMNDATLAPRGAAPIACALLGAVLVAACNHTDQPDSSVRPSFLVDVTSVSYDAISDDLLTAGLGQSGLQSDFQPSVSSSPKASELRRLAIWTNYRALVDVTAAGGFGTLYGPKVGNDGTPLTTDGRIGGTEYTAFSDDGSGRQRVTMVVQIPSNFNPAAPCIVAAASPGSLGVYGAISTAEWGLKQGCAVALNDKGTGAAPHDLRNDTVPLIDGQRAAAASAAASSQFNAGLTAAELGAFNALTPDRYAFKHAHSGQNPEKDWGRYTLQSVQFAFWALNQVFGAVAFDGAHQARFKPGNTLVIASSASNGGGAAIAAAELDIDGLIDGVAVAEPAIEMPASPNVSVQRGSTGVATVGKPLVDFITWAGLFQSCASQSAQVASAPGLAYVVAASAANRCASLHAKGLLAATTPAAQADEALQKLLDYGWEPESSALHASLAASTLTSMYGTGSGTAPTSGIDLVNNLSVGGPLRDRDSVSASTGVQDFNLDGAVCLRNLVVGSDAAAAALRTGLDETRRSGRLNGKPVLIVHGRADALLPVNHTSRPYAALAHSLDPASKLSYIEVTNAQHFDSFIDQAALAGYDTRFVPLQVYLARALNAMYATLRSGAALPPSQVVRTLPRGGSAGAAPAISASNVPAIASAPAAGDAITYSGSTIHVPD